MIWVLKRIRNTVDVFKSLNGWPNCTPGLVGARHAANWQDHHETTWRDSNMSTDTGRDKEPLKIMNIGEDIRSHARHLHGRPLNLSFDQRYLQCVEPL